MRKTALLAVLMALILLMSSCSLVVKDQAVDDATEIIRMGDQVITKKEVKAEVQNQLDYMAYYYSLYGYPYDTEDAGAIAQAQESAIEDLKQDLALTAKAKELGLDQLTDEETEAVKADAQKSYEDAQEYVKTYMLDSTEGMDEAAIAQAVEDKLAELGVGLESYVESATKSKIDDKLHEYAVKDVVVTDEEIQADYDEKVKADKESYEGKAGSWATAANNGTTLYYTPAGVRRVKQILTKFKDEDQTAIDDAKKQVTDANSAVSAAQAKIDAAQKTIEEIDGIEDEAVKAEQAEDRAKAEEDKAAAEQELADANAALEAANKAVEDATNKAFENIDADADAILASLKEGADWQALMDEKNQDPGMKDNEKGYAVAADMTGFDSAFVDAAMLLRKPGDVSNKVKGTSYGYYIIRYESDEPEGPIALDQVKETISSSLLSTKKTEAYNAAVAQWVEEAGIKVDLNALKD